MIEYFIYGGLSLVGISLLSGIKVLNQYEKGVKFTLGKLSGTIEPGLRFVFPLIQNYIRLDMRQKTIDLKPQRVMTKDNVSLTIDGVIFYLIDNPENAILNVFDLKKQIEDKATSELKEIIGSKTMTEGLSQRDKIAEELMKKLNYSVNDEVEKDIKKRKSWGVNIRAIQINNIQLPEELVRAMSKQAEAEREAEARKTKASGESAAANEFKNASLIYANNPGALRLRELQTFQEIGTEHNSLMLVIPSDMATGDSKWTIPLAKDFLSQQEKLNKSTHKK
jgi:regulator of protease activity HflC (stomatin/prohibitin superfamily)